MSQLERTRDNTLKQVAGRERDEAYKELQHKLLGVQAQLRKAGSLVRQEAPAVMVPSAAPTAAVALPPGWSSRVHPSSNQVYYVKDATGERRWEPPTSAECSVSGSMRGRRDRSRGPSRTLPWRPLRKRRGTSPPTIDPLDPLGLSGGRYPDGLHHKGERMADSTASGPLWQQRPYPAPGSVLKMRSPGVREGGIGPFEEARRGPPARMMPPQANLRRRPPPPPPPRASGQSLPPGLKRGGANTYCDGLGGRRDDVWSAAVDSDVDREDLTPRFDASNGGAARFRTTRPSARRRRHSTQQTTTQIAMSTNRPPATPATKLKSVSQQLFSFAAQHVFRQSPSSKGSSVTTQSPQRSLALRRPTGQPPANSLCWQISHACAARTRQAPSSAYMRCVLP